MPIYELDESGKRPHLMSLARNVRTLRIAAHMSVEQLAQATNLTVSEISSIENGGRNESHRQVQAIAEKFGVTEATLRAE